MISAGRETARIEALPVEQWREELEKIGDEAVRAAVRSNLETIYWLKKRAIKP